MKLRLAEGSLRLRLDEKDLAALKEEGRIGTATRLTAERSLAYRVIVDDETPEIEVRFRGDEILVALPAARARSWLGGDGVGLDASLGCGDGSRLSVLVEKDLGCDHDPSRRQKAKAP